MFQVPLTVPEVVLWSKIPLLFLPFHLSLPVEKLGKVGEIGKLNLSSMGGDAVNEIVLFGLP